MLGMIHGMVRLPEQLLGFLTAGGEKADTRLFREFFRCLCVRE